MPFVNQRKSWCSRWPYNWWACNNDYQVWVRCMLCGAIKGFANWYQDMNNLCPCHQEKVDEGQVWIIGQFPTKEQAIAEETLDVLNRTGNR